MLYVKRVEGNVKGASTADLGPRTLIVGPNGAGKSAIVNGVELALSGRASDVVGRAEVSRGIDLLALAPAADDSLWAKATLSDGGEVGWSCEKNHKTGGSREPVLSGRGVPVSFPVREVRAALEGKPETARAFLLGRVGQTVTREAVAATVPDDLRTYFDVLAKPLAGSPVDVLLQVRELAAKHARAASSEATLAQKMADERAAGLAGEPSEADVAARAGEAEVARNALSAFVVGGASPQEIAAALNRAEGLVKVVQALEVQRRPGLDPETASMYGDLSRWLSLHVESNADSCVVCGAGLSSGHLSVMRTRVQGIQAEVAAASIEAQYLRAVELATDAVEQYRNLAAKGTASGTVGVSRSDVEIRVTQADRLYRATVEARAAWSFVRDSRAKARDAETRGRVYRDLAAACEDATGDLLSFARSSFVECVQSFLPATDRFDLVLHEHGKDVCRFGFLRDEHLHTALSGAEWARLMLALAAAVTPDNEASVSILTPEERAFDPDTLRAVLIALKDAPGQVLLTSPVKPTGRLPAGWTLVDLSGA